jgi:hypothetical protein
MKNTQCHGFPRRWPALVAALIVALAGNCKKNETEDPRPPPGTDAQSGLDGPGSAGPDGSTTPSDTPLPLPSDARRDSGDGPRAEAAAPRPDSAPPGPPMACGEIRNCVSRCGANAACATQCSAEAPPEEQMAFMALDACSKRVCPAQDATCRC